MELYSQFEKKKDLEVLLNLLYTDNFYYKESHFFEDSFQNKKAFLIKYSKIFNAYSPKKLKRKSTEITIDVLERQEFDLFIPTYYDPYFLAHIKNKPFVLTVYDMIHELYPHYFTDDPDTVANKKTADRKSY